jgi:aspartate aminotransferase-like enzyme
MGFVDPFDVLAGVTAIGLTLNKLGASTDVAKAMSAMTLEMGK